MDNDENAANKTDAAFKAFLSKAGSDLLNKVPREIPDNLPYMVWVKDVQGRFIFVNKAFTDIHVKSHDSVLGKTDFDVYEKERAAKNAKDDQEVINTGSKSSSEEMIYVRGKIKWFEIYRTPLFDTAGMIIGMVGTAKDITKRKSYERQLKEQHEYSAMLLNTMPSAVISIDNDKKITSWNKRAEEITGYTAEDIMNKQCGIFFCNPCRDECSFLPADATLPVTDLECSIRTKNGETRIVSKNVDSLRNESGEVIGRIECFDDITDKIQTEARLRESELRLNLSIKGGRIGLWDWKMPNGELITNDHWADMAGYTLDELKPVTIDTWRELAHPEDFSKSWDILERCFSKNLDHYETEIRMKHKNGSWIWVLSRGEVIEWDNDGMPVRMVGTHINISKRKFAEEKLEKKEKILSAVALSIKELLGNLDFYDAVKKCFKMLGNAASIDKAFLYENNYDKDGNGTTTEKVRWITSSEESRQTRPYLADIGFGSIGGFIEPLIRGKAYCGFVKEIQDSNVRKYLESQGLLSFVALPVFVRDVFWGFISFEEYKYERQWTDAEFSTLSAFANAIGKTIERKLIENELENKNVKLEEAYAEMEKLAMTDPLTKLYNRREIYRRIDHEIVRFERSGSRFAVIIADIDHFKTVNDTYGHEFGDSVLKGIAGILKGSVRKQDFVSRWGGEEFLLLLPETTPEGAVLLAEKLRKAIDREIFHYDNKSVKLTMTFGVSAFSAGMNVDGLVDSADKALYKGKQSGRNRVVSARA